MRFHAQRELLIIVAVDIVAGEIVRPSIPPAIRNDDAPMFDEASRTMRGPSGGGCAAEQNQTELQINLAHAVLVPV
jgi:hypothetical protein